MVHEINVNDLMEKVDKRIKERSILNHPFYEQWKAGKLTKEMLCKYAGQYYKHVSAFPQYLSRVHSKIDNGEDRKVVLQNLIDEEYGSEVVANHPELWLRFGEAIGLRRQEMIDCEATANTQAFVNHFKMCSGKGIVDGIAALYTYESQIPEVSKEKIDGLRKFYGVDSKEGLEYFEVHMTADVEHSKAERVLIEKYVKKDKISEEHVLEVVDKTLDSYWSMLSGIQGICEDKC